jgi:hypothetical protein
MADVAIGIDLFLDIAEETLVLDSKRKHHL